MSMKNRKRLMAYTQALTDDPELTYDDLDEYGISLRDSEGEYRPFKRDITEDEFWTLKKIVDQHLEVEG